MKTNDTKFMQPLNTRSCKRRVMMVGFANFIILSEHMYNEKFQFRNFGIVLHVTDFSYKFEFNS